MKPFDTSGTLLTYALATSQNPVEVSPSSTEPSITNLTFVASCPMNVGSCTVRQIEIALPVGDPSEPDPTDLTEVAPPLSAASISSSDGTVWGVTAGVAPGAFIFAPQSGPALIEAQALTLTISGIEVGLLVGTAEIVMSEWAAPGSDAPPAPPAPASGRTTFAVAKFPAGFFAFDFAPSAPQVASGSSVTLTWQGSTDAIFRIGYDDVGPVEVTDVRSWTSPPLYVATTFILYASASQGGQTVTLEQSTTVTVAAPQVVSFYATPNQIDIDQTVTLSWRAVDADGVYLLTGETGRETLAPVSDPDNPYLLQPQYGVGYALQAFKGEGDAQTTSSPMALSYTYNPVVFVGLSADPTTIDAQNPSTTVSWEVQNALAAYLNGSQVSLKGSLPQTPTVSPTRYALTATWVDGSIQTGPTLELDVKAVSVDKVAVYFNDLGAELQISILATVENATSGTLTDMGLIAQMNAEQEAATAPSQPLADGDMDFNQIGPDQWLWQTTFQKAYIQNWGIQFGYCFEGIGPVSTPAGTLCVAWSPGDGTYPPSS